MEQASSHGCGSAHQAEKPTDILSDEHRVIERVLDALQGLTTVPVNQSLGDWLKAMEFSEALLINVITSKRRNFYFQPWKSTASRATVDRSG